MLSISFIENLLEIIFIMEHECTLNLEITHEIFKPPKLLHQTYSVVASAFQITFRAKIYVNDVFSFF